MNNLTYNDYINYLKIKFSAYQGAYILPEDMPAYQKVKERLEDASSLPSYILEAPLLDSVNLDAEALAAIIEIKETIANKNLLDSRLQLLMDKVNQFFSVQLSSNVFVGVAISFLFVAIISLLFFLGSPEINNLPLAGAADGNGSTNTGSISLINTGVVTMFLAIVVLLLIVTTRKK